MFCGWIMVERCFFFRISLTLSQALAFYLSCANTINNAFSSLSIDTIQHANKLFREKIHFFFQIKTKKIIMTIKL
jgi:hypothetical protein